MIPFVHDHAIAKEKTRPGYNVVKMHNTGEVAVRIGISQFAFSYHSGFPFLFTELRKLSPMLLCLFLIACAELSWYEQLVYV